MKRNLCIATILVFLMLAAHENMAQKLMVRMMNGLENAEPLNSVQKLYFNNNELIVDYYAGSDDNYFLSDVRKIYFDLTVGLNDPPVSSGVGVYPTEPAYRENFQVHHSGINPGIVPRGGIHPTLGCVRCLCLAGFHS